MAIAEIAPVRNENENRWRSNIRRALIPLVYGSTTKGKDLVTVKDAVVDRPVSFKLDVMPVFMKAGCNSGSCHGAARGKDGLDLARIVHQQQVNVIGLEHL